MPKLQKVSGDIAIRTLEKLGMKNPAAETAGYLNVRNCFFIFAR